MKLALLSVFLLAAAPAVAPTKNVFSVSGDQVLFNGKPFKVIGLRVSNALLSDAETTELIQQLDVYKSYGMNTVSAYFMGSRFGDLKGYRPDASLEPAVAARMGRLIEAADARDMIVLTGCLYWSTSRAKEDLGAWTQTQADAAVANTVRWLKANGYRNVFVDPDNEGMSPFSIEKMIAAAKAVDPTIMLCANETNTAPANADLLVHHSPKVAGKPWIQTEGSSGGYWGTYSKETHEKTGGKYYNYSRIGRYSGAMKTELINNAKNDINNRNGYMLASTWLQCAPNEGVGGPFHALGGRSNIADVNKDIDVLHPDAGVLWWAEAMKAAYGAWTPPTSPAPAGDGAFLEKGGTLSLEAEHYATRTPSTYAGYQQVHAWEFRTDPAGYSGDGFMQALPDERGEDAIGPSSPRDATGARMTYPIRISTAGTYRVWVRGWSMGGESNGVHVGVDGVLAGTGAGASNMSGFRPHGQWVWENGRKDGYAQPATLPLAAGDHTLMVWNRDDGFRIDKLVLTTSTTAPAGSGPAESPRAPSGTNAPPAVALASPADGSSYAAPASIALLATASDADGAVAKVEFFAGAAKIGEAAGAPYSITWNNIPEGSYALTARATDDRGATTTSAPVQVTVGGGAAGPALASLTLIDADTGAPVAGFDPLHDGAVINLAALPTRRLSVRANPAAGVGSVRFGLDGDANHRTESTEPYALFGDAQGVYTPWTPALGAHAVSATPYALDGAGGAAGATLVVSFSVIDEPGTSGSNAPAAAPAEGRDNENGDAWINDKLCGALGAEALLLLLLARRRSWRG